MVRLILFSTLALICLWVAPSPSEAGYKKPQQNHGWGWQRHGQNQGSNNGGHGKGGGGQGQNQKYGHGKSNHGQQSSGYKCPQQVQQGWRPSHGGNNGGYGHSG